MAPQRVSVQVDHSARLLAALTAWDGVCRREGCVCASLSMSSQLVAHSTRRLLTAGAPVCKTWGVERDTRQVRHLAISWSVSAATPGETAS
jgi:hypothetical protein